MKMSSSTSTISSRKGNELTKALLALNLAFDDTGTGTGTLKLLDPVIQQHSRDMITQAEEFHERYKIFHRCVHEIMSTLQSNATIIDSERMAALGLHQEIENIEVIRKIGERYMVSEIGRARSELQRLKDEYGEMKRIETEQKSAIDRFNKL